MFADVVLPRGLDNEVAIKIVAEHVQLEMNKRSFLLRRELKHEGSDEFVIMIEGDKLVPEVVERVLSKTKASEQNLYGVLVEIDDFNSLRQEFPANISTGTILMSHHELNHDPILLNSDLKSNLENMIIIIIDHQIATGLAAIMAIRVLLDHGASEENIGFGCLGCTQQGLKNIRKAFPKVSVFTQKLVDYDINNGPRLKL